MSAIKWFSCRAPAQNHHHVSSISRSLSAVVTPELCELGKKNMSKALLKAGPGTPRAWRAALRGGPAFLLRRAKRGLPHCFGSGSAAGISLSGMPENSAISSPVSTASRRRRSSSTPLFARRRGGRAPHPFYVNSFYHRRGITGAQDSLATSPLCCVSSLHLGASLGASVSCSAVVSPLASCTRRDGGGNVLPRETCLRKASTACGHGFILLPPLLPPRCSTTGGRGPHHVGTSDRC
jgi:hypothetical protein